MNLAANSPLLSVVIPTYRRPTFLPRAIESALSAAPEGDVEILVVPNGTDTSWRTIAEAYRHDYRISWSHLTEGNACKARNHGLSLANGKYVRFLDDDDYFFPAAAEQLIKLNDAGADISSAPMCDMASNGILLGKTKIPDSGDYLSAALLSVRLSLSEGSIFLRHTIGAARWREDVALYDDYLWMLEHAKTRDPAWLRFDKPVCAYVHHLNARLSYARRTSSNTSHMVKAILGLHEQLINTKRLTPERAHAIAVALLSHAHSAFPASPNYLASVIQTARKIHPAARPAHALFMRRRILAKHMLAAEWLMLAPRIVTRSLRRLMRRAGSFFTH